MNVLFYARDAEASFGDGLLVMDTNAAARAVSLPSPQGFASEVIEVMNVGENPVTVTTRGTGAKINNSTSYVISAQFQTSRFIANGKDGSDARWYVASEAGRSTQEGEFNVVTQEPAPSAPTAVNGGAGTCTLEEGDYQWKVVFVTEEGHTEASAASEALTVDPAAEDPPMVTIPTGSSFVTAREIYRTAVDDSTFLLVDTVADNTTTTFADDVADEDLGAEAPSTNTTANPKLVVSPNAAILGRISDDGTNVIISGLPIEDPEIEGALWFDGGALAVSEG